MADQMLPANKISKTKITIPYCFRKFLVPCILNGKKLNNIHEPSSGGIGIKLNTASQMFITTIYVRAISMPWLAEIKE